jgi:hypothetical protein
MPDVSAEGAFHPGGDRFHYPEPMECLLPGV